MVDRHLLSKEPVSLYSETMDVVVRLTNHHIGILLAAIAGLVMLLAATDTRADECRSPSLSGPPLWPPFINPEAENRPRSGIAIDFVETIFDGIGLDYEIAPAKPWPRVLKELENGDLDILFTLMDSPERRRIFNYTEHWMTDIYAVITYKGGAFEYRSTDDLRNRMGAMIHGHRVPPPFGDALKENVNLITVTNPTQMHKMLRLGRVDFVVASVASFMALIPDGFHKDDFQVLAPSAVRIPIYMAISKQSPCDGLLEDMNAQILKHRDQYIASVYEGIITN